MPAVPRTSARAQVTRVVEEVARLQQGASPRAQAMSPRAPRAAKQGLPPQGLPPQGLNASQVAHDAYAPLPDGRAPVPYGQPGAPPRLRALGEPFVVLRQSLGLTRRDVAFRLQTTPEIIAALEMGAVRELPPWPEIVRLVNVLTVGLGIDPRPMLEALAGAIAVDRGERPQVPASRVQPVSAHRPVQRASRDHPTVRRSAEPEKQRQTPGLPKTQIPQSHRPGPAEAVSHPRLPWRLVRRTVWVALPAGLLALLFQVQGLGAAMATLPRPAARLVREVSDFVLLQMAPTREGLRWIEVADPRARRTDKLPVKRR